MRTLPFPFITLTTTALLLLTACGDDGPATTATDGPDTTTDQGSSTGPDATTTTGPDATTTTASSTGVDDTTADATTGSTGDTDPPTGDSTGPAGLEIAGEWFEEFAPGDGITHVIDETTWQQLARFGDALFHVDSYDDEARWVVAQADAANEFFPELYSRFDWTWDGEDLYYCTAVYDAATPADALAGPASDPDDLAMGCGGFPWSPLQPVR